AYTVRQSTHEIGIRMALGAHRLSIVGSLVGRSLRIGTLGATLGTVPALVAGRLLRDLLFGVSASDGLSFLSALALVVGAVAVSAFVSAWRAVPVDSVSALRHMQIRRHAHAKPH